MELSRRQVLVASLAMPVVGWATNGVRSAPTPTSLVMDEVGDREVRFFSSDFTTAFRLTFPGAVEITRGSSEAPRVLNISANADTRVVTSTDVVSPTTLNEAAIGILTDGGDTVADYRAALNPQLGDWKDMSVALPFVVRPLYPNDGLDGVGGIEFEVNPAQKGGTSSTSHPEVLLSGGLAWGAVLNVGWANTRAAGKDGLFSYPAFVACTAVGPGDVPAGAKIAITADRRCLSGIAAVRTGMPVDKVFSDFYNETRNETSLAVDTEITILNAIPAGQSIRLIIDASVVADPAPIARETIVRLIAPEESRDWQRQTQREIVRNSKVVLDDGKRTVRGNK